MRPRFINDYFCIKLFFPQTTGNNTPPLGCKFALMILSNAFLQQVVFSKYHVRSIPCREALYLTWWLLGILNISYSSIPYRTSRR